MATRRDAMSPRAGRDGKTYWHKIGIAMDSEKGTTIYLDSLPIADKDGRVAIMLFEPRERGEGPPAERPAAPPAGARKVGGNLDDEIPF